MSSHPFITIPLLSDAIKSYFTNAFSSEKKLKHVYPVNESADYWENSLLLNPDFSALSLLSGCYPQLSFPIKADINKTGDYREAVLKGLPVKKPMAEGLQLNHAEQIKILIHQSIAGKIPVITIPDGQDFSTMIQCLLHKNNPVSIPASMGAAFINGISNWKRIHVLKQKWYCNNPKNSWSSEFSSAVLPHPELFKDQLIILGKKSYSNIPVENLNFTKQDWLNHSSSIRLEHECAHLYTAKKYGVASNNLHDELIADYMGLVKTFGHYKADLMLTFLGLENFPHYRPGARLENYFPAAGFGTQDFTQLISVIKNAVRSIKIFDEEIGCISSLIDEESRIEALCETDLLAIASERGFSLLLENYNQILKNKCSLPGL